MKSIVIIFALLLFGQQELKAQLVPYRFSEKWGYCDTAGNIVIEPRFQLADFFESNMAFVKIDTMYYGINKKGEVITEAFKQYGRFKEGLCPVTTHKGKAYFINEEGKNPFGKIFSAAENFSEGRAIVSMQKKLGIIDTKGAWVREPGFDSSSIYYKSGFLLAKDKGRFFYIDKKGKTLELAENIQPAGIFSEGLAGVYVKSQILENNTIRTFYNLQFIDSTGKVVLSNFFYEGINYADYINYEKEFKDGKAIINVPSDMAYKRFFINKKGEFSEEFSYAQHLSDSMYLGVIGFMLPSIRFYDSMFFTKGEFDMPITSVGIFGNKLVPVQNKAGYWGYCNKYADVIIPFIYESAEQFVNGFAIVKKNGRMGVINTYGKEFFREY
ncbi:MAG: WG repeat-containing protein [Bacteroidota bacterium]